MWHLNHLIEVIKIRATQLSMKFLQLINVKMPAIVYLVYLSLTKPNFLLFHTYEHSKFHAHLS